MYPSLIIYGVVPPFDQLAEEIKNTLPTKQEGEKTPPAEFEMTEIKKPENHIDSTDT